MALGALEKNAVIDRQKNPGPGESRYRILWEEPPAEPIPTRTRSGMLVVTPPNLFDFLVLDEIEVVASQPAPTPAKTLEDQDSGRPAKRALPAFRVFSGSRRPGARRA
jgi:hypothetical protein